MLKQKYPFKVNKKASNKNTPIGLGCSKLAIETLK